MQFYFPYFTQFQGISISHNLQCFPFCSQAYLNHTQPFLSPWSLMGIFLFLRPIPSPYGSCHFVHIRDMVLLTIYSPFLHFHCSNGTFPSACKHAEVYFILINSNVKDLTNQQPFHNKLFKGNLIFFVSFMNIFIHSLMYSTNVYWFLLGYSND